MSFNTFNTSTLVATTLAPFITTMSNFYKVAYRGISEWEFENNQYAPGQVVNIKTPGYPTATIGLTSTAEALVDRTFAYVNNPDDDTYSVTHEVNVASIFQDIIGGAKALTGNSQLDKSLLDPRNFNPQALVKIDDYFTPAATVLVQKLETVITEKARINTFYCPVSLPSDLTSINNFSNVNAVKTFMDEYGFLSYRYGLMNTNDFASVSDSLSNSFNTEKNSKVLLEGGLGKQLAGFQDMSSNNTINGTDASPQYIANNTSVGVTISAVQTDSNGYVTGLTLTGVISTTGVVFNAGTLIAIPAVRYLSKATKLSPRTLVVTVNEEALGDGAGNVTITFTEPLIASDMQANVNVLPVVGNQALVFNGHRNNYFLISMGVVANTLPLWDIEGAKNGQYRDKKDRIAMNSYIQGQVTTLINTFRTVMWCPTLIMPPYIVRLPSFAAPFSVNT